MHGLAGRAAPPALLLQPRCAPPPPPQHPTGRWVAPLHVPAAAAAADAASNASASVSSSSAGASSTGQQQQQQQHSQDQQRAYPYNSGDGRSQKATLEHIFRPDGGDSSTGGRASTSGAVQAPWSVGWQVNERNLVWNDELKLRLIKHVASQELHISEQELEERLQMVFNLLPDLADRLVKAPPQRVAQLAASTDLIAARLLRLREIFPQANTSALIGNRLSLLLDDDLDEVAAAATRLRALLPMLVVDRFVEAYPTVLDVAEFEAALQDARRLMPQLDVAATLRSNPEMILECMKGSHLIPYDPVPPRAGGP